MSAERRVVRSAAGGALVAGTAGLAAAGWLLSRTATSAWTAISSSPSPDPDDAVSLLAAVAGVAVCGWLALGLALALLDALAGALGRVARPGGRSAERTAERIAEGIAGTSRLARAAEAITPALLRRAVALAVGISLAAGPAHAALLVGGGIGGGIASGIGGGLGAGATGGTGGAGTSGAGTSGAVPRVASQVVDPGWGAASRSVTVHPGDTLWRLARRSLPASATNAQIARTWPRWYAANHVVIGADANVIQPGQLLLPPDQPDQPDPLDQPHHSNRPGSP